MMRKPPTIYALATEICLQFPNAPSRTLARKLYNENKELISTLDAARDAIRRARGNHGKVLRKYATVRRPNGKSGWVPECPPSVAEDWKPVLIEGPCTVFGISDTHIPFHSKEAIETAVNYARKKHKPDVVVINGDGNDFYNISRFDKDPKHRDLKNELEVGKQFRSYVRGKFPDSRFIEKLGNHGERWDHWIWNKAAELWNVEAIQYHNVLDFEKYGIERVDDQPIMAGKLPILHGHEFGRSGIAAPVNPARGAFLRTLHTCLVGHLHRTSSHAESDMWSKEIFCWSQGCLCGLNPAYARVNRWNHGFVIIEVAKDGTFNVMNYRVTGGEVRTS